MVQRVLRLRKHSLSSPWVGTTDGKGYVVASYSFRSQPVDAMPKALERRVSCAYPIVTRGPDPCFARSRNKVIIAKVIQPPVNKIPASNISSPRIGPRLARWTSSDTLDAGDRVNRDLPVISNCLDAKNPNVIAAEPPTDGASQGDMMAWLAVIVGENLAPMSIGLKVLPTQHRGIEISLQPTGSRSPNIEIAVAPRLENQEDNGKNARKEQRQR